MDTLPPGLSDMVLLKLSPKYMLRLLPAISHLYSDKGSDHASILHTSKNRTDLFLWRYIDKDQDRLHELFGEVAKVGWWELFRYLWYHRLGINDTSIRERRSLQLGWEQAFRSNHIDVAMQIFEIDPYFHYKYYTEYINRIIKISLVASDRCSGPFMRMKLIMAVEDNDYEKFSSLYTEFISTSRDIVGIERTVILALSKSPSLEFYEKATTLVGNAVGSHEVYTIHTRIMTQMLNDGRFEFVQEFARTPIYKDNRIYWEGILQSQRPYSLDLFISTLPRGWDRRLNCFGIPNYCELIFKSLSIGNRELLEKFIDDGLANRFMIELTEDYDSIEEVIIFSYKTLEPERFIQVLRLLLKRPNNEKYIADQLNHQLEYMELLGYDYLIKQIKSILATL